MDIVGKIELISESETLLSMGNIIAIIVAVISLTGVIISTVWTNRTTKKINKDNAELQEKWNQKNIDANLIAQARIEWIQNVRKTTSELLVHYFAMLNLANIKNINQELINSQEKNELLILYFGNDTTNIIEEDLNRESLLNEESNKGKNHLLVELLLDLAKRFSQYSIDVKNDRTSKLKNAVDEARKEMYKNATMQKIGEEWIEDIDDFIPVEEPEYQEDDVQNLVRTESALKKERKKIEALQDDLILLRDAIRTYLKIEWEIAKQGK